MLSDKQRLFRPDYNVFWIQNGFQLKLKKFLKWFLEVAKKCRLRNPLPLQHNAASNKFFTDDHCKYWSIVFSSEGELSLFLVFSFSLDIFITVHNKTSNFTY